MGLDKTKQNDVNDLQQEIAEEVLAGISLTGIGKEEWIRANLVKENDSSLSGKYTFITKNPATVEYIPGCKKIDFLMSLLVELTEKKKITASVYPDKSVKIS